MSSAGLVDLHHHLVPDAYRAALVRAGAGTVGGIPLPPWEAGSMLERMDRLGIERAVLSVSAPALLPAAPGERTTLARLCNDEAAELVAAHPGRLGAFALLPLPDVDGALHEIDRALGSLGLDGVSLLTNYEGRYLGHEALRPVLEELDRRAAVVHVHPNLPPPMRDAELLLPAPVLEFTFDTTRAVADLIAGEVLDRCPDVRFVLSHLGGSLPFLAHRLSMLDAVPSGATPARPRTTVLAQLRRLHYDVALSGSPANLHFAAEVVGIERLVYGSDTPFAPPPFVEAGARVLAELPDAERAAIGRANALRLLGQS
ncbi:MAG TPA: amidohydrolase family protein [Solirubrobacteraceae bacterium]|nr:amidohydrolase family protein [Solirubrobacteraceae bacterium]